MREISREAALLAGLKRYFTGLVCPQGHHAERWVSTRGCCACTVEKLRRERDKIKTERHSKQCAAEECSNLLPGSRRKYCSQKCNHTQWLRNMPEDRRLLDIARSKAWNAENRDKVRENNRRRNRKQRAAYVAIQILLRDGVLSDAIQKTIEEASKNAL